MRLEQNDFPSPRVSYEMMAQSVAGLAAKAVNEGRGDELVWIGNEPMTRRGLLVYWCNIQIWK